MTLRHYSSPILDRIPLRWVSSFMFQCILLIFEIKKLWQWTFKVVGHLPFAAVYEYNDHAMSLIIVCLLVFTVLSSHHFWQFLSTAVHSLNLTEHSSKFSEWSCVWIFGNLFFHCATTPKMVILYANNKNTQYTVKLRTLTNSTRTIINLRGFIQDQVLIVLGSPEK
jgi:hypothetical protein